MSSPAEIPSPFYRVSLKALVFDDQRRLLVVREFADAWEAPGGGWEHGETLEECLDRELGEELGVGLAGIEAATLHPSTGFVSDRRFQRLKLSVLASIDGTPAPCGEVLEVRWVTPSELRTLDAPPGDASMRAHIDSSWPT